MIARDARSSLFHRWHGLVLLGFLLACCLGSLATAQTKKEPKDPEKQGPKKEEPIPTKAVDKGPFQNLKYRSIGPVIGGRVCCVAGAPDDANVYYQGTASGGLWKSTDGGKTWKPIFDDQPTATIGALAVAPSSSNVLYVGSGEPDIRGNVAPGNGIYRSSDGGKTWKHVWKQRGQIGRIVVDPHDADVAYAAVLGSAFGPNPERGVYRTTDGGKTWEQVLKKNADTGAIDLCLDPENPKVLLAAFWQARRTPWSMTSGGPGSGLYRSEDAGDTWKELAAGQDGLPEGPWGRIAVAIAPSDSERIYVLIEAKNGGLFRSDDGGKKWELINGERYLQVRPWYFSVLTIDPSNADVVFVGNLNLLRSSDGGKSFKKVKGPHHVDHHDLWIDPKNPLRMIDANDGGADVSTDGGETWKVTKLPICQFYHINVDNSVPYRVMGNMQDQGTASGPSNSLDSDGINLRHWHGVGGGETGFSVADPTDPQIVYSGEYMGILTRYDHRTRQSQNISIYPGTFSGLGAEDLKYRFQWTAPLLLSKHDPKTIYHAANVLFRSQDQGKNWTVVSGDLTRDDKSKQKYSGGSINGDNTGAEFYCTIFALAESPVKPGILWAGSDDGLVHVSSDAGKSWSNVTKNLLGLPEWGTVCCIEASPHDANVAYVVVDNHRQNDNQPYLWRTADLGRSWTRLTEKLPEDDYLRVIRADPKKPGLLFLGSEHGVSFSRDEGKTWEKLKLNLPTVAVSDLQVKDNDLVVGTNGRSVWILDDLTPIREWDKKSAKSNFVFPIQPAKRWRYHESWVGEDPTPGTNPPRGTVFHYQLETSPKKPLVLEIFDSTGRRIRSLSSRKEKPAWEEEQPDAPATLPKPVQLETKPGLHRVAWDHAWEGPRIIPGAKNDWGVPVVGPLAAAGTYSVKLQIDDQVLTAKFEIEPDPRAKFSVDDSKAHHTLVVELFDGIGKVSEITRQLQSVRGQLQARVTLLKDHEPAKKWRADVAESVAKLNILEEKLHNPRAKVNYDILAQEGGARLYSQLTALFEILRDGEGPLTQGMREQSKAQFAELRRLEAEWAQWVAQDLRRLQEEAQKLPNFVIPKID